MDLFNASTAGAGRRPTLEKELQRVREESVAASRSGDVRKVAQLTRAAAQINSQLRAQDDSNL